ELRTHARAAVDVRVSDGTAADGAELAGGVGDRQAGGVVVSVGSGPGLSNSQGIEEFFAHVHDRGSSAPTSQCVLTLPTACSPREASDDTGRSRRIGKSGQKTSIPW